MLISLSEVDAPAHPSTPSSALPPATTSRFMPALPWWTVLTWERRLSTLLNPLPHLSHRKGFSPERAGQRTREVINSTGERLSPYLFHYCEAPLLFDSNFVLTCVNDNVFRQVSHINKCLVTHPTLVRPDIVVMPNVIGQLTGLHKPVQRQTKDISLIWLPAFTLASHLDLEI